MSRELADLAFQKQIHDRHAELLKRYLDPPFSRRVMNLDLEAELDEIETLLLDRPPLYKAPNGSLCRRRPGLLVENRLPPPQLTSMATIPVSEWTDLIEDPDAADFQQYNRFTLDQDGVGSCGAEGATGLLMDTRHFTLQEPVKLNPWFVYHTTSGGHDGGSSLQDNVAFLQKYGAASQEVWPRSKGWRAEPSDEAKQDALKYRLTEVARVSSKQEFGTCLLLGRGVYFGYSGHAIYATKLLSTTRFVYKNSWGDWGDDGFGTLSFDRVHWGYGAYCFLSVLHSTPFM